MVDEKSARWEGLSRIYRRYAELFHRPSVCMAESWIPADAAVVLPLYGNCVLCKDGQECLPVTELDGHALQTWTLTEECGYPIGRVDREYFHDEPGMITKL